jgi:hypothetical protein
MVEHRLGTLMVKKPTRALYVQLLLPPFASGSTVRSPGSPPSRLPSACPKLEVYGRSWNNDHGAIPSDAIPRIQGAEREAYLKLYFRTAWALYECRKVVGQR